jgi:diguanylate cyclase (GGDEF)-like protein
MEDSGFEEVLEAEGAGRRQGMRAACLRAGGLFATLTMLFGGVLLYAYLTERNTSDRVVAARQIMAANAVASLIEADLAEAASDLRFLARLVAMDEDDQSGGHERRRSLGRAFAAFARSGTSYCGVRFYGTAGRLRIEYDRLCEDVRVYGPHDDAPAAPADDLHGNVGSGIRVFMLDHSELECVPDHAKEGAPRVRLSRPIMTEAGQRVGRIALDLACAGLAKQLENVPAMPDEAVLVDAGGKMLGRPSGARRMRNRTLPQELTGGVWDAIREGSEGSVRTPDGIVAFATIRWPRTGDAMEPDEDSRSGGRIVWKVVSHIPETVLAKRVLAWRYWTLGGFLALEGLVLAAAIIHARELLHRWSVEEDLRNAALRDPLTNLYNRRFGFSMLEHEMKRSERTGRPLGVYMIDVDELKRANDRLGHAAGDRLLRDVADGLKTGLRDADIICRVGGDEFAVGLPGTTLEEGEQTLQRVRSEIREKTRGRDRGLEAGFSFGGAVHDPERPGTLPELLEEADRRMFADKRARKNEGDGRRAGDGSRRDGQEGEGKE